jgi:hypothetical protein
MVFSVSLLLSSECGVILSKAIVKPQEPLILEWTTNAGRAGDLVVYQNGYGKYFLETIDNKSLLEIASKIEIKEYNNKTYIYMRILSQIFF